MGAVDQIRSLAPRDHLARLFHGIARRAVAPVAAKLETVEENQYQLARELLRARAMRSQAAGEPIRVLFLCHIGSVWGKVSPLFRELRDDPRFRVDVIGLPYRHSSFGDDEYHDAEVIEFLRDEEGIEPIGAYDASCDHWLDLQSRGPDYIFYPTPYDSQYPPKYSSARTKYFARLCYVPYYGTEIMRGDILKTTHPHEFYANLTFAFVAHEDERRVVLQAHADALGSLDAPIVGAPMLDPIFAPHPGSESAATWNFPDDSDRVRILWTPRWHVEEGTCHFPDYSDHLLDYVRRHPEVDFVFRPHPLMLNNFVTRGDMTRSEVADLFTRYEELPNARIDESDSYLATFSTSNILISDISSMMVEYAATGKPIIYTHRIDNFNEFGRELASSFYWVKNKGDLDKALEQLVAGDDPLRETRYRVVADLLKQPTGTVSSRIADLLAERF